MKKRTIKPSNEEIVAAHINQPKRRRGKGSPEDGIFDWLKRHGEMPFGKHAKADIHRRYVLIRRKHECDSGCQKPVRDARSKLSFLRRSP